MSANKLSKALYLYNTLNAPYIARCDEEWRRVKKAVRKINIYLKKHYRIDIDYKEDEDGRLWHCR